MSYIRKSDVISAIKTRVQKVSGSDYTIFEAYLGTDPFTRKPVRMASKSKEKLNKAITEFYRKLSFGGDYAVLLNAQQSVDARKAYDLLKENGHDISLVECVTRYLRGEKDFEPCEITVGEAYKTYLGEQNGKSAYHEQAVSARVGKWVLSFGETRPLSDVTAEEVERNLTNRLFSEKSEEQKTTYNNHLGYIKTFLRWCGPDGKEYLKKNPLANLKPKTKAWRDKEYLHAEDCFKLFYVLAKPGYETDLADAILSFMCGLRQEEIKRVRLGPSAVVINLEERFIRVIACKGSTKNVQPRVFTIPDQAYAWMQSFNFMEAVMKPNKNFRQHLVDAAKAVGINRLPENCGRHTFCTMFDAAFHDNIKLTAIAGNSEDVRAKHYNGLATEKEGKMFFTILPSRKVSASHESATQHVSSLRQASGEPSQAHT